MKLTSLSYVPTPSKSIMVSQGMHILVFDFSSLKLYLICSGIQKSGSNFSLVFSQSDITVVAPLVYVILAPMKLYLLVPSAKLTDTNLMGRHHKHIFIISPLSHDCVLWFRTHHMPKKMQYRSKHQHDPTKITDIFDGAHYCLLLETPVTIGDEELPM